MADVTLRAEKIPTNPQSSHALHHAYRYAKAAWDIELYGPDNFDVDLPDEINDPLSDAHTEALNKFLICPVDTLADLARKLRVFRDEEVQDGWFMADQIVAALCRDADRLLKGLRR